MKKLFIWGTGRICEQIINNLIECDIIGFIETEKSKNFYRGRCVYSIEELPHSYDILLIANNYVDSIYKICVEKGIDLEKTCFLKKPSGLIDITHNLSLAKEVMDISLYEKVCCEFGDIKYDWIVRDAKKYSVLNKRESMKIDELHNMYIYSDKMDKAGAIHSYFWQDLWAARKVFKNKPLKHYDIGSRVDGFISHLLAFRDNVYLIDIRQLDRDVNGLNFIRADATNLDEFEDNSIESLSALCSLEHFGLGRYGDSIDPEACYKCFEAICRKVKQKADIYISVPVGWEHIEFNAHRVFFASTIVEAFSKCELIEYSCTANGFIEYNIDVHKYDEDRGLGGGRFGLFHFIKK